ncbi:hypothetical protein [Botrimarina mediterranea]|uniref:Uncharacterized protein n=1 Tax=Botrimarina mediterranea TaxID=2528022 RepID=A0A518K8Y8_9BACT|nr:hypothetical protein [Botrimarina mediterranea]QDV74237.1 hypothetical protein Spa11_24370 [Botrimarina mediterranea]QDV78868.1 hypothetical protein K2D_24760 [Planctomycetes bacterium K2D]
MSTTPPKDAAVAHVARCLRLNPMWQADGVLASRAELHGVDAAKLNPYQAALDESARKQALRNKVYALRDEVWEAPIEEIRKKLNRLRLEGEPELAKLAVRLRVIVDAREELPRLTQHRDFNDDFFECFKQVLTGSVRQSAEMRERVAASFQDRRLKKRGVRMVTLLQREHPELAALEYEWLDYIIRHHAGYWNEAHYVMTKNVDIGEYYWQPHWAIVLLIWFTSPVGGTVWIAVSAVICVKRLVKAK